jgi:hypothetical protein
MDWLALGDHAEQLLRAIVKDISSPQTDEEREQKSNVTRRYALGPAHQKDD